MSEQQVRIVLPETEFTLFDAVCNDLPEVLMVNGALRGFEHRYIFPWHLCVTLYADELIENGMPSEAESELLFRIGDEIEAAVLDARTTFGGPNALFLSRSTWNATRELSFLVHDPEVADTDLQRLLQSRQWARGWEYEMDADPDWAKAETVFRLFPPVSEHDGKSDGA